MRNVALLIFVTTSVLARADELTPWTNLAGLKRFSPSVHVMLTLRGAEELGVNAKEVQALVLTELAKEGLVGPKSTDLPQVQVLISGEGTGGGGASYTVETLVTAYVPSPFGANRTIQAVVWPGIESEQQAMTYDPKRKKIIKPPGAPKHRIRATVLEVVRSLIGDVAKANPQRSPG
jgi:hypothetical protein